jgi:D-xylose transport system substrate-binding protein
MMRAIARTAALVATLVLGATLLTGCENAVGGGKGPAVDPDRAKIGLLLPDSVTSRYESADRPYFEARVTELCPDCQVLYANADGDSAKQQQQAESMLTQGVSVLVLDPFDGKAAATIVGQAKAQGVPVISYDRLIDSPDSAYYISFDNERVGELQAAALIERLEEDEVDPDSGGILMVNGSPTDNNASQFKRGAHSVIDDSRYHVLAETDIPGWDPAKAQDWVAGQITQFGDKIIGVYGANDQMGGASIAALKAVGVTPLPPVTGQDAELAGIQRILAGDQYMTVYKALKPEAEKAAELAIELIAGRHPEGATSVPTSSGVGIPSFLLTPVAVTVDQIESTVIADDFYTADQICTAEYRSACTAHGIG